MAADASIVFDTRLDPSGFKSGIDNIDNSFIKMRDTLADVASASEDAFDNKAQDGLDKLSQKLARQLEELEKARAAVSLLGEEYAKLVSGEQQPKSVTNLIKDLGLVNAEIEKEIANNNRLVQSFAEAGDAVKTLTEGKLGGAFIGNNVVSSVDVASQVQQSLGVELDESSRKLDEMNARAKTLSTSLSQVKLDPSISQEARETGTELELAASKANRLSNEAQSTEAKIKQALDAKVPDKWAASVERGTNASHRMASGINEVGRHAKTSTGIIEKMAKKLVSMAKTMIVFYLFRNAISSMRSYLGDLLKTNEQFTKSLNTIKVNLKTAFQPIYQAILPSLNLLMQALVKASQYLALFISMLFGKTYEESKAAAEAANEEAEALKNVGKAADKSAGSLQAFDEVNKIQTDTSSSATSSSDAFEEAPMPEFNPKWVAILQKVSDGIRETITWIKDNFDKILTVVEAIGISILAWKVAQGLITALKFIAGLGTLSLGFVLPAIGSLGFLSDLIEFMKYFNDFKENGATFGNVTGMISEFAGMVGDILIILGKSKIGAALKLIQGVGEIVIAIEDMTKNGINWENAMTFVRGLSNLAIGIGVYIGIATGNFRVAGIGVALQGFSTIITQISENWEAIKKGDWSGVDKAAMVVAVLEVLGGIALALGAFSKVKDVADAGKAAAALKPVGDTVGQLSTATGGLSTKLTSLAKNLGMGIVIIAEVAVAAILIVAAIWVLGKGLEQVGIAWEPVIANAGTIAIAMGIGIAFLAAIGVVTALLGSVGASLILNIALGTAMLLLIGVAAVLFLAEIWLIGKGLDEIGKAWQPVIDNGENIALAIGLGTALLIAIGVVTALLGVATVASAGLLPLAIALGTAILLELGVAAVLFIAEIVIIGLALQAIGVAWQPVLDNGETIAKGIELGTALLIGIGVATALLGVASVASVGLLPLAIALGTAILVELSESFIIFTENLVKVADELTYKLSPSLRNLNDSMPTLSSDLKSFIGFMEQFAGYMVDYTKASASSKLTATIDTVIGWFTKDPIKKLADDVEKNYNQFVVLNGKLNLVIPEMGKARDMLKSYTTLMDEIQTTTSGKGKITLSNDIFINMKDYGKNLTSGLAEGIKQNSGLVVSSFNSMLNGMSNSLNSWVTNLVSVFNQIMAVIAKISGSMPNAGKSPVPQVNISNTNIPRLAQGGLIPPNNPRTVMVGDSREDEIVSPRSAIREEVMNALAQFGGGGEETTTIVVNLDGEQIYKNVIRRTERDRRRTGMSPVTV